MNEAIKIVDFILSELNAELERLRPEVFDNKYCGRSWEKSLQMYDECLLKIYQTKFIKSKLLEATDEKINTKDLRMP